jgi:1,4-dihydroxy-6-naphthoate synthase
MTVSIEVSLGHSPDSDDAFMAYALTEGLVDTGNVRYRVVQHDIQTLNKMAMAGELDVSAVSAHCFALICHEYAVFTHGASFGRNYGPCLVVRDVVEASALKGKRIAVPGLLTSAYLGLRMFLRDFEPVPMVFDRIMEAVRDREVDAGLVIHEGQLTHREFGLTQVWNLGEWWNGESGGLPLPLGLVVVRKSLGAEVMAAVSTHLKASIAYGFTHRPEALEFSKHFARDLPTSIVDRFVSMYVNDLSADMGDAGRLGLQAYLERAHGAGLLRHVPALEFIS